MTSRTFLLMALALAPVGGSLHAGQLPLPSVRYFNPFQNPTNWANGGSAIYLGGGATVRNYAGTIPVDNLAGTSAMVLDAVNPPGGWWNAFFKVSGNPLNWLRTGTNPAIHLRLKWNAVPTNNAWNMTVRISAGLRWDTALNADLPLSAYVTTPSNTWQDVCIPASAFKAVRPTLDLTRVWWIVLMPAGNYRDHCTLNIAALDLVPSATNLAYGEFVKVNQLGYAPFMREKLAVVSWESGAITNPPTWFQVVNTTNGQAVFTGTLSRFVQDTGWLGSGWALDGDVIYHANFGELQAPGTYRVELPELGARSPDFRVAADVNDHLGRDCLRFFYYSRSGEPIFEPFAEGFLRAALHADNTNAAYNYDPAHGHFNFGTNTTRDVHGCWFDAGDTHIDVPATATACWFLLETARDFGANVPPGSLNLPESSAQQGDLVPLVRHALDWLKRMQNPDGSVHHYVLGDPDTATQRQQVSDISSFATACAAAAFAKTCALWHDVLPPAEAADLLARARLAWSWLQANTNMVQSRLPLQNGVDPGADDTNPYWGDANFDRRSRAYAAVELFEATGEAPFNDYFVARFNQNGGTPLDGPVFGFNKTGYAIDNVLTYLNHALNFAFMDYARSRRAVDADVQTALRNAFLHQANVLTNYTGLSGYRIPMLYPGHLYWGSCGGVLTPSAMVLVRAFEWTGDSNYQEAAVQSLHFICGRNPVNRVFVSGYGDYVHGSDFYSHFWTDLLRQPPGYLGANIDVDGSAQFVVEQPWKRFINTQDADMTEPGVYWNSAFTWLAGYAANDAAPPSLQIAANPGGLALSWLLRSTPFALYGTTNLSPLTSWAVITNQPALSNGVWRIVLPANSAGSRFYRLQGQ